MNDAEWDQLITPSELQEWLGCGRSTTYQLLETGAIRSYRVARLIRIKRSDVIAFLEQNPYRPDDLQ